MAGPFKIMSGVRRAVAAREAGLTSFRAVVVDANGHTVVPEQEVPLDAMFSPKELVERIDPRQRYLNIERGMADPVTRAKIPTMEIMPIGLGYAKRLTPVADVELVT